MLSFANTAGKVGIFEMEKELRWNKDMYEFILPDFTILTQRDA